MQIAGPFSVKQANRDSVPDRAHLATCHRQVRSPEASIAIEAPFAPRHLVDRDEMATLRAEGGVP